MRATNAHSDAIILTGLRADAHHGVFDFEREAGQPFFLDVTVWLDLAPASAGDDLASTLHYGELASEIVAAVERDPVDLIETVAERVASLVLAHPATEAVEVTVHKPQAPISVPFQDVAVRVHRERVSNGAPEALIVPAASDGAARITGAAARHAAPPSDGPGS